MKNLSSLTTFFITFLFVVYLGVFTGFGINRLLSNKKIAIVDVVPVASAAVQPTPVASIGLTETPKPQVVLQNKAVSVPKPVVVVSTPTVVDTATPPPTSSVDTQTPPPVQAVPDPTSAPVPSADPPSNKCVITISGSQYDVTDFRNIHSGGDIFQCGSDMTAAFLDRHPASFLQQMAKYKI